jgi:uncharacterized protein (TIGR03435 family)
MLIRAQTSPEKPPSFEVASVKASPKGERAHLPAIDPSLLSVKGTTLKGLVMLAYSVPPTDPYKVAGGPEWVDTDPYDVDARPEAPSSRADMISMLRSLLADRFRLLVHREARDVTMNVLVVAKGGPRFGPQFHAVVDGHPPSDLGRPSIARLSYPGFTIEAFLNRLRVLMTRDPLTGSFVGIQDVPPLLDGTGLSGRYDIVLNGDTEEDWSSMLERQLGLKLVRRKVSVETTVIDSATKPASN